MILRSCFLLLTSIFGWSPPADGGARPSPVRDPRLTVVIVVDQMRGDYLSRFSEHFSASGFRRLLDGGAFFANASVPYLPSETAPGHATISTGAWPRQHGVIANKWFIRPGDAQPHAAVDDDTVKLIDSDPMKGKGQSPKNLRGTTIGDQLKLADKRSRVFSVALKSRSAIFMAGKNPDRVLWCDKPSGHFVTSTYYTQTLPDYAAKWNAGGGLQQYAGKTWEPLLGIDVYAGTRQCDPAWAKLLPGFGTSLPHQIPAAAGGKMANMYSEIIFATPFANDAVLEIAGAMVTTERLGRGPAPDMLFVGLSANDHAGHLFGPDSAEMLDITLRTDRQLAQFFDLLDKEIGLTHCLIALTADHGVTSPEQLLKQSHLGGGTIDEFALKARMNESLAKLADPADSPKPLIRDIDLPWIYFHPDFAELDHRASGRLTQAAVDCLQHTPGIARVFTTAQLEGAAPPESDPEYLLAWRGYFPHRSGQLEVKLDALWEPSDPLAIAKHSSGSRNDRHVPILLCGPRVRAGKYFEPADLTDIAVTIAAIMGIEAPETATGRVLSEALSR